MLNFYRRFLLDAAATQAPLHALLAGPRTKLSQTITWTPAFSQSFEECKVSLSRAAMLAHPDGTAPIALVTDASVMKRNFGINFWKKKRYARTRKIY